MVFYEVTATPDPDVRAAYETYMLEKHIRDVLDTGHFVSATFAAASNGQYRTTYVAADQEQLDRYLDQHAQRLRADFARHMPSGVTLSREVWRVVEEFKAPS